MIQGRALTTVTLIVLLMSSSPSFAGAAKACPDVRGTDLVFPKGRELRVLRYDEESDTYEIGSQNFPGEDPSTVTPDALAQTVPKVREIKRELREHPEEIIDAVYKPEADVPTLTTKQLAQRKLCASGKK